MSSRGRTILVTARQAGSAMALAPVVHALTARGDAVLVSAASSAAEAAFAASGVASPLALPAGPQVPELTEELRSRAVSGVLTGTSFEPRLDGRFWSAADRAGIPAVAVLDHWCNYAERFSDRARFDCLPAVLAVMDDGAASRLSALGFPSERLHVTGHPQLSSIQCVAPRERAAARRKLGVEDGRAVITFASEVIRGGLDSSTAWGALDVVRSAVALVAPDALVVFRPHPRETRLPSIVGQPETIVNRSGAPRDAIAASDVVTGVTSILLLEAALAGIATLSVRPGGGPDEYLEAHADLIVSLTEASALPGALEAALNRAPGSQSPAAAGRGAPEIDAVHRVVALRDEKIERFGARRTAAAV
jgi:hypothetical protein